MDKLNYRIQRQNNLNEVYVSNEPEDMFNGVHHKYSISTVQEPSTIVSELMFQKGPRKDPNSMHGVIEGDLLEIVRDRLQGHQASEYKTREGALALTAVEEALLWLTKRADDRAERGVLGTTEK